MSDISPINRATFEMIKRLDKNGSEYWSARDLQVVLEYTEWRNFINVINKAKEACENSGNKISDHFVDANKMVDIGSGVKRNIENNYLSRYACYLIALNGDPKKEIIANAQTYFAVQTRKQEIVDEFEKDKKRLYLRNEVKNHNTKLASAAKNAGVIDPYDFAIFQDKGYQGLYNGLGKKAIARKKGLKESAPILDYMGSTELAANLFRATQTEDKLRNENIQGKEQANKTHFDVGRRVRKAIADIGGVMPENLPFEQNIKTIEKKQKEILKEKEDI